MKNTLIPLIPFAVAVALTGTAKAQTSITAYGIVDAGIVSERGGPAGSVTKLTSGVQSGSRLGFRGTEDLGGGLSAKFVLETGIAVDTGGFNQGNTAFARQSYVGLNGNFGSVTMGRQYTPHYLVLTTIDPFGTGLAGDSQNLVASPTRMNNTIIYATPELAGFSADLAYGFGEVAGNSHANRQIGTSFGYAAGPLYVRLGHHRSEDAIASGTAKNTILGATYDFKVVKASFAYNRNTGFSTIDSRDWLAGVSVPFGPSTVMASYIRKDDKSAANQDAHQLAIGYTYALSKRTNFYTSYARIDNKNGAAFTVGSAIETGSGDKAFNLGVRHVF